MRVHSFDLRDIVACRTYICVCVGAVVCVCLDVSHVSVCVCLLCVVCVCARAFLRACVRACVHSWVRACVRACVGAFVGVCVWGCVWMCGYVCVCLFVCACVECVDEIHSKIIRAYCQHEMLCMCSKLCGIFLGVGLSSL